MADKTTPTTENNFIKDDKVFIYWSFDESIQRNIIPKLMNIIETKKKEKEPKIEIYINSGGWYVASAFELIAIIEKAKKDWIEIITHAYWACHSAASVLFVLWNKRYISDYTMYIIHDCRWEVYQSNRKMIQNTANYINTINDNMVNIYMKYTKANKKRLEDIMMQDMYAVPVEEMKKLWFADFIV